MELGKQPVIQIKWGKCCPPAPGWQLTGDLLRFPAIGNSENHTLMIIWNEDYSTGIATIDRQHKLLIDQINQLEEVVANPKPTEPEIRFADSLVNFLEAYSKMHFGLEENCMAAYRCPAYALNELQPNEFLEFIERFRHKFNAEGFSVEAFKELHEMTSSWITRHILRVGGQLFPCVQSSRPERFEKHQFQTC